MLTAATMGSIPGFIDTITAFEGVISSTLITALNNSQKTMAGLEQEISALSAEAVKLTQKSFDSFINEIDAISGAVGLQSTPSSQAPATTWFSTDSAKTERSAALER